MYLYAYWGLAFAIIILLTIYAILNSKYEHYRDIYLGNRHLNLFFIFFFVKIQIQMWFFLIACGSYLDNEKYLIYLACTMPF